MVCYLPMLSIFPNLYPVIVYANVQFVTKEFKMYDLYEFKGRELLNYK